MYGWIHFEFDYFFAYPIGLLFMWGTLLPQLYPDGGGKFLARHLLATDAQARAAQVGPRHLGNFLIFLARNNMGVSLAQIASHSM